jgi:hypothetical protein
METGGPRGRGGRGGGLIYITKTSQAKQGQAKPSQAKQSQAKPSKAKQSQAMPSKVKQRQAKPEQSFNSISISITVKHNIISASFNNPMWLNEPAW